ncbi:MAG: hypothetical protein ACKOC1_11460 [Hyphomicrobiales bacterium]
MSFLFRFLSVVALIYAMSPVQLDLPTWIKQTILATVHSPSVEGERSTGHSVMQATISACKSYPNACSRAIEVAASVSHRTSDPNDFVNILSERNRTEGVFHMVHPSETETTGSINENIPLPPRRAYKRDFAERHDRQFLIKVLP